MPNCGLSVQYYGTVCNQKWNTVPQFLNLKQHLFCEFRKGLLRDVMHNQWNCDTLLHSLRSCSAKSGTVPQFVELFHKLWNCSTLCRSSWILPTFVVLQSFNKGLHCNKFFLKVGKFRSKRWSQIEFKLDEVTQLYMLRQICKLRAGGTDS